MNLFKSAKDFGSEHGSSVCTVLAVFGIALTVYETWKARPKVDKIMEEHKVRAEEITCDEALTEEEKKKAYHDNNVHAAKRVAVAVVPLAGSAFGTASLAVTSRVIDAKKVTNLTGALSLSDVAYQKLDAKTRELLGDEKADEIKAEIAKDSITEKKFLERTPSGTEFDEVALTTKCVIQAAFCKGDTLIYDLYGGRLFSASKSEFMNACVRANLDLSSGKEPYLTYNEFMHNYIGLPNAEGFDSTGFGGTSSTRQTVIEPNLNNTCMVGDEPVIVLEWINRPTSQFK